MTAAVSGESQHQERYGGKKQWQQRHGHDHHAVFEDLSPFFVDDRADVSHQLPP